MRGAPGASRLAPGGGGFFLSARLRRLVARLDRRARLTVGVFWRAAPEPPEKFPTGKNRRLGIGPVGVGAVARASPALITEQAGPARHQGAERRGEKESRDTKPRSGAERKKHANLGHRR